MNITDDDIKNKINIIEIDEEKLIFTIKEIEKKKETFYLYGDGNFDGEVYKDFALEIKLEEHKEEKSLKEFLEKDWIWYDLKFNF